MSAVLTIAREEWRFWLRSKVAIAAMVASMLLLLTSVVSTIERISAEQEVRHQFQHTAEHRFRDQPDRHPHRMVHYGHYVARNPVPLSLLDPGVDPYTGTILFLEGHRQNTAAFSPRYSSAKAGPFSELSPALVYQTFIPLLMVFLGFSLIARERESGTYPLLLTASVSPGEIWLGKALALASLGGLMLIPLLAVLLYVLTPGESLSIVAIFLVGYSCYLLFWVALILAMSAIVQRANQALSVLLVCWMVFCVIVPKLASSSVDLLAPIDGKVATDMEVVKAKRALGDGHNSNDPAFQQLRNELLKKHNVDRVEELPFNIRGRVAQIAEAELTDLLNEFAQRQQNQEHQQTKFIYWLGLLSPALATRSFSTIIASTDLSNHHGFLNKAEGLRFDFVQKLNALHEKKLAYSDDILRSKDAASEQRTRVDAANWQLLQEFQHNSQPAITRLQASLPQLFIVLVWTLIASLLGLHYSKQFRGGLNE